MTRVGTVAVTVSALQEDPEPGVLDIATLSDPAKTPAAHLYLLPATGQLSWSVDGSNPFSGPVTVRGTDGEVTLSPVSS